MIPMIALSLHPTRNRGTIKSVNPFTFSQKAAPTLSEHHRNPLPCNLVHSQAAKDLL